MKRCLVSLALTAVLLVSTALGADPASGGGAVAIILDCSSSMGEPVVLGPDKIRQTADEGSKTRMDCAQQILREMVRELSESDKYSVGIWLYGHRLAWEDDSNSPQLLSQDQYLGATNGFLALNNLLPGDDVERIQSIKALEFQDLEAITWKLDAVRPWGEKPLYMAINQAMDALSNDPSTAQSMIVLTDGGNYQRLAKHRTTQKRTLEKLGRHIVPIHFLHLGPEGENAADELELREVAAQGGGSFAHVKDSDTIVLDDLLSSGRKVAKAPVAEAKTGENSDVAAKVAEAKALLKPVERNVAGRIVCSGRPVLKATIKIEGSDIATVEADRQGRFLIRDVPSGRGYRLQIEAIALNRHRHKTVDVTVEKADLDQPLLMIDLNK
jgi:hypothetical protein